MNNNGKIDPSIFREYDIRGIVDENFSPDVVHKIARQFAQRVKDNCSANTTSNEIPSIAIARDGRLSSPVLAESLSEGIRNAGVNVVDIGIAPTPMLYYTSISRQMHGGIMLTGSHNPPDHNGMKFMLSGKAFYGADILSLRDKINALDKINESPELLKTAEEKTSEEKTTTEKGEYSTLDIKEEYLNILLAAYSAKRPLSVAWDAGNGATGEIMSELCNKLPGVHFPINATIDGNFPAHHPDPTIPENLHQLIDVVKAQNCDLGIAFDGDGDRIGIVDDEGEIIWGDQLLMLYAADLLREKPGATIIADVKASGALFEEITRLGGNAVMWKTGHSLIKAKMAESGALLAGEMSGHIFFADKYLGFDDGLYAAIRLLDLLAKGNIKLSALKAQLPQRISTPELRFPCPENRKNEIIKEVKNRLQQENHAFSDIDGVRVTTNEGWWLLRASNTQALLVARCEAETKQNLEKLKNQLTNQLQKSGINLKID